jgi:hypothetical protein
LEIVNSEVEEFDDLLLFVGSQFSAVSNRCDPLGRVAARLDVKSR